MLSSRRARIGKNAARNAKRRRAPRRIKKKKLLHDLREKKRPWTLTLMQGGKKINYLDLEPETCQTMVSPNRKGGASLPVAYTRVNKEKGHPGVWAKQILLSQEGKRCDMLHTRGVQSNGYAQLVGCGRGRGFPSLGKFEWFPGARASQLHILEEYERSGGEPAHVSLLIEGGD